MPWPSAMAFWSTLIFMIRRVAAQRPARMVGAMRPALPPRKARPRATTPSRRATLARGSALISWVLTRSDMGSSVLMVEPVASWMPFMVASLVPPQVRVVKGSRKNTSTAPSRLRVRIRFDLGVMGILVGKAGLRYCTLAGSCELAEKIAP